MQKYKKALSLIMSIIMTLSVFTSTGIYAMADIGNENNHDTSNGETIDPELCEHSWSEWVSNNDATILEDGTKTRHCLICGIEQTTTDEGSRLKHEYGWFYYEGEWYFFDESSNLVTNNWALDSHGWVYLGNDGRIVKNTWALDSQGWCYLDSNGYLVTNAWIMDSQGWCYLDGTGHCVTNKWMADSHGWLYLDKEGRMLKNGWALDSQGWCYLDSNGYLATNTWAMDSQGWCYLDETGHCVTNKWVTDSHGMCYIDVNGRYDVELTNGYLKINERFLELVNEERARMGVGSLSMNPILNNYAQTRAVELETLFAHQRPDGSSCFTIVNTNEYPYHYLGENIFTLRTTEKLTLNAETIEHLASQAFISFKNSPPHYENMINGNFQENGIACHIIYKDGYTYFYVEHFFGTQLS